MEEQRIFPVGRTGRRSLWVSHNLGHYSHPGLRGRSPKEAEGCLSRDAGVLRGSRDVVGTLKAIGGTWAPREPQGKPKPWPPRHLLPPRLLPWGLVLLPGHRFTTGECLLGTPRTEAADSYTEKGARALGD